MYVFARGATKRDCAIFFCTSLLVACQTQAELAFFDRSAWSQPIHCTTRRPLNEGAGVSDLFSIGDSAFAALFADERTVIAYDRTFAEVHRLQFDEAGPRGVRHAVSAALTDTMFFIADDASSLIKRFDRAGQERGSIRLQFIPRRIRLSRDQLLVTPLVAGSTPAHLLFAVEGNKLKPLAAPIAQYDDIGINTLANLTSLVTFPNRAVLMHELVVPFGYVFYLDRQREIRRRFAVPLSDYVRDGIGRLPGPPLTDKNVNDLTVVAFAAAARIATGSTYYVTRIGDGRRVPYAKLLVELDSTMHLRAVHPIDVNPHHMVFVTSPAAIIAVDAESNWFECKLP